MDRASNLEALAEEEDEEQWGNSDDSEDDEQGDGGIKKGEPNKFDSLCDGVLGSLGIVHAGLHELLELKDELLKHALPPNVLTKLALSTTKVFRSITDMHMPCNELIRLVRIYSTPWEEKSAALKKLHEDYESKKAQLNIAIKRLQLIDAHSKRMAHEKRIMNWEKLFAKLTMARGHGRRWKFLIESFKKKAKLGPEKLQEYIDAMGDASDSEDDEDEMDNIETQMSAMEPSEGVTEQTTEKEDESSDEETDSKVGKDMELEPEIDASKVPTFVRPPMTDKGVWTGEAEYDRFLHLRVYSPEGLDVKDLKCVFTCGNQYHKTKILDSLEEDIADPQPEVKKEGTPVPSPDPKKTGSRGRLIGTRGGKQGEAENLLKPPTQPKKESPKIFEEVIFKMPDIDPRGIYVPLDKKMDMPQHLKVAVHFGPREEMTAMATIDMDDLDSLDLPVVYLPGPIGDTPGPAKEISGRESVAGSDLDSLKSVEINSVKSEAPEKLDLAEVNKLSPIKFPLYALQAQGDALHRASGTVPLVAFWERKLVPKTIDRAADAGSIRDIVLEATGFDLHEVTKEDLHKETVERCISAMSLPESEGKKEEGVEENEEQEEEAGEEGGEDGEAKAEETVLRKDYDRLKGQHQEEMEMLQNEYEQRLQDLAEAMEQMSSMRIEPPPRSMSSTSLRTTPPHLSRSASPPPRKEQIRPSPPIRIRRTDEGTQTPKPRRTKLNKNLPIWGENLPKDFFERLRMFQEESQRHKEELFERVNREVSDTVERKLASEYKLGGPVDEDNYNPLKDVCLPAVFMPSKTGRDLTIFNPRAAKYFHASGAGGVRLTQPPSMVTLPPIPRNKLNVVNLFDTGQQMNQRGQQENILMQQYLEHQEEEQSQSAVHHEPFTSVPAYTTCMHTQESGHTDAVMGSVTPVRQREAVAD